MKLGMRFVLVPLLFATTLITGAPRAAVGDAEDASEAVSLARPAVPVVRLRNGLTVVVEENHRLPLVSMHLRYAVGLA